MPDGLHAGDVSTSGSPAPALWRVPLGWLSPAGRSARLTILIFHRVRPSIDPLFPREIDARAFRSRLRWLREWFNVLPLHEAVEALARGGLPARALCITFDDGYADNAHVALPLLAEAGLHATFFVATGYVDGGQMWNDTVIEAVRATAVERLDLSASGLGIHPVGSTPERRAAIDALLAKLKYLPPEERGESVVGIARAAGYAHDGSLMMTSEDVRRLASAGMGIGAHTVHHPILASVSDAMARDEIAASREALEGWIREPVRLFAYPNGKPGQDYRERDVRLVREAGFAAAFSTSAGAARSGDSLHELPRFTPWDATPSRWGARLARNYFTSVQRAAA